MMKDKKIIIKLLLELFIVLTIISICNNVNANDTITENNNIQTIKNAVPDSMVLDIKEIEFEQAPDLVKTKLEEILKNKGIDISELSIGTSLDTRESDMFKVFAHISYKRYC